MGVIYLVRREHPGLLSMLTLMHITAIEVFLKQCYQGNQAQRYIFAVVLHDKCYIGSVNHLLVFLQRLTV